MLAPVIPTIKSTKDQKEVYVAQSPDLSGHYPVNPPINEKLNGSFIYYYGGIDDIIDSNIQIELCYQKGLLEGAVKIYTNNGNLYCEGQYSGNKKTGEWKFYAIDGSIAEIGYYDPSKDNSFNKCDKLIEPFLTPSYFEYGFDTASTQEISSAHVIPLLNVGYNREEGRTGTWKMLNNSGEIIGEKTY